MNTSSATMPVRGDVRPVAATDMRVALALSVVAVVIQMVTNGRYGYFRDELYFLATSDHLAFGYVDFAPLSSFILHVWRMVFGSSLHAIRLLPALAFGFNVYLTGLIVRELGGRRFATLLACGSVLLAPVIVGNATRYSMNPFEPLFWMGCAYFVIVAIKRDQPKLFLWCGVLLGFGLENKHSTAFFLLALTAGLLLTSRRRMLRSKYFWIAALLVAWIALPNVIWQVRHGFPTWEDLRNVQKTHKNVELAPPAFVGQQIMMLNPVAALVWIAGLVYLLFHPDGRRYRALGLTFLVFFLTMMVLHGKDYYVAPIYPMLFAAGGVVWERWTSGSKLQWVRVALPIAVFAVGIVALPLTIPMLPVQDIQPYIAALGLKNEKTETHHEGPLPQHFSDEFGWEELVQKTAQLYYSLPPDVRAKTAIWGGSYGDAGAIDFFGPRYGLPKSISSHQNYYFWGPRDYTGESIILLHWRKASAQRWCNHIEEGPTLSNPWSMDEEHYTIWLCQGLKVPLKDLWPRAKEWN